MMAISDLRKASSQDSMTSIRSQSPPAINQNVRYVLAKQKIDDLFLKFLSQASTTDLIEGLLRDVKNGNVTETNLPPPIFASTKIPNMSSSMTASALLQSPISKSPQKSQSHFTQPATSPRSPTEKDSKQKGNTKSFVEGSPHRNASKHPHGMASVVMTSSVVLQQSMIMNKASYDEIPLFYFGETAIVPDQDLLESKNKLLSELVGKKTELDMKEIKELTTSVFSLPSFFANLIAARLSKPAIPASAITPETKVSKLALVNLWKNELSSKDPVESCFHILKKPQSTVTYIDRDDLMPLMKVLLDQHPGLEFLRATPEFQDRYAETVIIRIMFLVNRSDNGRITWKEFKKSNLFNVLMQVDGDDDINKVRDYFSYEHFYVLYCKFWELDQDHDFFITKEEFSKYSGHALSRKTVDRIFDQHPRKFKSPDPAKMGYEDFIWFVLAEEDKTTQPSIEYWFKVIDLDENGIISGYEMNYFFEEQKQRYEFLTNDCVNFEDVICQMVDLLKPEDDIKFYMRHFKAKQQQCGVFFNFMTNLNKFVSYETRDPFEQRRELTEHPGYSDWDRFAHNEYQRLAVEEENQENGEVFNDGSDPWDQDTADSSNI